jgi:hypothetical protein
VAGNLTGFAEGYGHWCMICIVMDAANGMLYRLLLTQTALVKNFHTNVITNLTDSEPGQCSSAPTQCSLTGSDQKRFIYRLLTRHGCLPVWLVAA